MLAEGQTPEGTHAQKSNFKNMENAKSEFKFGDLKPFGTCHFDLCLTEFLDWESEISKNTKKGQKH